MKRMFAIAAGVALIIGAGEIAAIPVASARALTRSAPRAAENLALTSAVRTAILNAAAKDDELPLGSYIGLSPGTAYYALDESTSTYWAGASLIPNPKSMEAEVSVQDDGGYLIFERPSSGSWSAHDVGLAGVEGSTCARDHVTVPPAVLAVWHWAPGTCKPPVSTAPATTTTTTTPDTAVGFLAAAKAQWVAGSKAISAIEDRYLAQTAILLVKAGLYSDDSGRGADMQVATAIKQLSTLPDAMLTPAQSAEARADTELGNEFFNTNGLWGTSTPSHTVAAFVVTLQQELRIGTLNAAPVVKAIPDAVVTCPFLTSLALNKGFGCRVSSARTGSYTMIGEIEFADAVAYDVDVVKGTPVYQCAGYLDASEETVLRELGGHCG